MSPVAQRNAKAHTERPMGTIITGTGVAIPSHVVTNDMLAEVMDTSDEWISARSGVKQAGMSNPVRRRLISPHEPGPKPSPMRVSTLGKSTQW